MSKQFAIVAVVAALCLAFAGCGSDGPNLQPELEKLTEQVGKQTEKLDELETDLETERKEATETQEELQEQLEEAQEETKAERQQRLDAEQREAEARQQAEAERREAAQVLEANQRAQELLDTLEDTAFPEATPLTSFTAPPEAAVSVATKDRLTFGAAKTASTAKSGFRYAKATDTFGRTRTTVIYTDRELSRRLLDHYGDHLEGTTQINVKAAEIAVYDLTASNSVASLTSRIPPTSGQTGDYTSPSNLTSLTGRVHGKPGTFRCTGIDCLITLDPTYTDNKLVTLAMTSTGTLVFEPGNAAISLCEDIPASCAFDDAEYMVFGYWIQDPESATGSYAVLPFAEVMQPGTGSQDLPSEGEARYTGAAVGVYVESAPFGSTEIDKRQGEFEAAVSLNATFGISGSTVNGWINNFRPTPRGGSAAPRTSNWRVTLAANTTAAAAGGTMTGSATIDGLQSTGNWAAQFVQARTDDASAEPPAVVGVFDASSAQSLHLVGAFGAKR